MMEKIGESTESEGATDRSEDCGPIYAAASNLMQYLSEALECIEVFLSVPLQFTYI